jgi:hypothetical protein
MKKLKRKCHGTTVRGKPCMAVPLRKGTVLEGATADGRFCRTHDPNLPEKARIQGKQPGAGRPKKPRVVDVLRERIEERVDEVIAVYLDAMKADRTVVIGKGEAAVVEKEVDHAIRLRAVEALNDRAYGKPGQALELTGKDGGPIEFNEDAFADPKTRKGLDELARRLGATR